MMRDRIERRSAVVLVFLRSLPRAVPGLVVLGLVALGVLAPPAVGAVALVLVGLLLGWLFYLSWPVLPLQGRVVRLVVVGVVVAGLVGRLTG